MDIKCENVYYDLLMLLRRKNYGSIFIRELMETKHCDDVFPMEELRSQVISRINNQGTPQSFDKIVNFNESSRDERIVTQTVIHYKPLIESKLLDTLSYPLWLKYHTLTRIEFKIASLCKTKL